MKKVNILLIILLICLIIPFIVFFSTSNTMRIVSITTEIINVLLSLFIIVNIKTRKKYILENKTIVFLIKTKEENKILSKAPVSVILFFRIFVWGIANIATDFYLYLK